MDSVETEKCSVCGRTVVAEESHVKVVRVGEAPIYFHETCMTFGVLFGRKDPLEARLEA
jgi:hypothetical protein